MKNFLIALVLILLGLGAILLFDFQVKSPGELPTVEGGKLPDAEVTGPDVDVKTEEKGISVPTDIDVKTEEKKVKLPTDIDVKLPSDKESTDVMKDSE